MAANPIRGRRRIKIKVEEILTTKKVINGSQHLEQVATKLQNAKEVAQVEMTTRPTAIVAEILVSKAALEGKADGVRPDKLRNIEVDKILRHRDHSLEGTNQDTVRGLRRSR